jgi:hypothetical protein
MTCSYFSSIVQISGSAPSGSGVNLLQAHHVGDEAGEEGRMNPFQRRPRIPKANITGSTALPREVASKINQASGITKASQRPGATAAEVPGSQRL